MRVALEQFFFGNRQENTMNITTIFQIPSGNTDLATSKMATGGAS